MLSYSKDADNWELHPGLARFGQPSVCLNMFLVLAQCFFLQTVIRAPVSVAFVQ